MATAMAATGVGWQGRLAAFVFPAKARSTVITVCLGLLLLAVPLSVGVVTGAGLAGYLGGRLHGPLAAIACLILPVGLTTLAVLQVPLVGLWDGVLEGLLLGIGVLVGGHRLFSSRANLTLASLGLLVSLVMFEALCRTFLPPPPAFPRESGPHLLLANALRIGSLNESWDARCKEVVCSILYGDAYPGIFDAGPLEEMLQLPRPQVDASEKPRRVLHVGDSMVFGMGVTREQRFTTKLGELEPDTEHINLGIPGTAPDAYFLVSRRWVNEHPVDMVVLYVLEGNDIAGLDDVYPCCGWEPLLLYEGDVAAMRCPESTPVSFRDAGATWLLYNSPPPYLLRALIGTSAAASHVSAAIVVGTRRQPRARAQSQDVALRHFDMILKANHAAMQDLSIPLVLVVLPSRFWVERPAEFEHLTPRLLLSASRTGVPGLDAFEALQEAISGGKQVFMEDPSDPHFNAMGHLLMARWLHERLPRP